eukprot:6196095-Pleurochrysis_carterae.AAC.4
MNGPISCVERALCSSLSASIAENSDCLLDVYAGTTTPRKKPNRPLPAWYVATALQVACVTGCTGSQSQIWHKWYARCRFGRLVVELKSDGHGVKCLQAMLHTMATRRPKLVRHDRKMGLLRNVPWAH